MVEYSTDLLVVTRVNDSAPYFLVNKTRVVDESYPYCRDCEDDCCLHAQAVTLALGLEASQTAEQLDMPF